MSNMLNSSSSVIHLLAASLAMMTGSYILFTPKGTTFHRLVGRLYSVSMAVVLFTAFHIYSLLGHFGIVHWGAVGSIIALAVGLGSVGFRTFLRSWLQWHYLGMGASITGLYAAFVVESTYRFFSPAYFWWVTLGLATVILGMGGFILYRHYPTWVKETNAGRLI